MSFTFETFPGSVPLNAKLIISESPASAFTLVSVPEANKGNASHLGLRQVAFQGFFKM